MLVKEVMQFSLDFSNRKSTTSPVVLDRRRENIKKFDHGFFVAHIRFKHVKRKKFTSDLLNFSLKILFISFCIFLKSGPMHTFVSVTLLQHSSR